MNKEAPAKSGTVEAGKDVVPMLACVLSQLVAKTDKITVLPNQITKFHALRAPAISIADYLARIAKYAACSSESFVLALIFLDRVVKRNPGFVVNSLNIHRLLITSVMLAAKFFDDHYYNNAYFSKVGGVPTSELNSLEAEMLRLLNYKLHVREAVYEQYRKDIFYRACNPTSCVCGFHKKLTGKEEFVQKLSREVSSGKHVEDSIKARRMGDQTVTNVVTT